MPDDLVCLVYYSSARHQFDVAALDRLLETSRRNNSACGVTGMLLFHEGNFIQALEGPRASVEKVFDRIKQDGTHGDVRAIGPLQIEQRYFPDWSMGVLANPLLTDAERGTVADFLRLNPGPDGDSSSIAWRLLNCFRDGVGRGA